MADDYKVAQPLEYYKHFLKENIRPDGRGLSEFRQSLLNIGTINTSFGSAVFKLGRTMVVCGITAELAEPTAENPRRGYFVPNVDLSPVCSSEIRPGPPDDKAQVLSQIVLDFFNNSKLFNLDDLCVEEKKLVWVIYADILCMSHDGNILDAVITAMYAALKNASFPLIKLNPETKAVEHVQHSHFKLNLSTDIVCTTMTVFDENIILVDPTHEEEVISSGVLTFLLGGNKQVYAVYKPSGCAVDNKLLQKCMQYALKRYEEVKDLMDKVTEEVDR